MRGFDLPVQVTRLSSGCYVASCPILEGCHAEGRTESEAVAKMEEIAKAIIETKQPFAVLAHSHTSLPKARSRCPIL